MNDITIKTASTFTAVAEFADEDTRTISLDNPKMNITAADFASLNAAAENVLIGDKNGAAFTRFKSPTRRDTTTTEIIFE